MHQFGTHPTIWPTIAQRVYRYDNTCACCGESLPLCIGEPGRPREAGDGHPTGQLHIYHLNGDRSDLRRWNLVQLCQHCGDGLDVVDLVKPLMFAPMPWLHPYIAGWIESHRGEVVCLPAGYNLAKWVRYHKRDVGREWPDHWAPVPVDYPRKTFFSVWLHPDHLSARLSATKVHLYCCHYPHLIQSKEARDDRKRRQSSRRKTAAGGCPQQPSTSTA